MTELAIIGGSGLNVIDRMQVTGQRPEATPYGEPAAPLLIGAFAGREIVFLPRHGRPHSVPPHRINYRANIQALHQCGVMTVIAINSVGGISRDMYPARLAVPDQIIDYTMSRPHTFFDGAGGQFVHIDFTRPYSEPLRRKLISSADRLRLDAHAGGTYGATQGPRLETAAEILRMERDGCDVVGMTGMPEAALARELDMAYASICVVANWAAGKSDGEITMEAIDENLAEGMNKVLRLLEAAVPML
ncbi:MAG: S-methyl-5'-thioinosine phosphorylase [Gammaproteobacteria bacterium]|nr:S-methyl-5'-thioinosine phosphorylase [Gammaproteobacteria bacterium]